MDYFIYTIDDSDMMVIEQIVKRLYDGTRLSYDGRREIAARLDSIRREALKTEERTTIPFTGA